MNKIERILNFAIDNILTENPVFDYPVQTACLVTGASITGFGLPVIGACALLTGTQNMMKAIRIMTPSRQDLSSEMQAGIIGILGLTCAALSFCLTTDTTLSFSTQVTVTVLATGILNAMLPVAHHYATLAKADIHKKIQLKGKEYYNSIQSPLVHISFGIGFQWLDHLLAKYLIWRGAHPNALENQDCIWVAVDHKKLSLVQLLIKHGANCNPITSPVSNIIRIPLNIACELANIEIVKFLTNNSANIHEIDNYNRNALDCVWITLTGHYFRYKTSCEISNDALEISTLLLKKGLEPSTQLQRYPLFQQFFNQFQASEFRKSKPLFKAELDIFNELNLMNHLHAFHSNPTPVTSSDGAFLEEIED